MVCDKNINPYIHINENTCFHSCYLSFIWTHMWTIYTIYILTVYDFIQCICPEGIYVLPQEGVIKYTNIFRDATYAARLIRELWKMSASASEDIFGPSAFWSGVVKQWLQMAPHTSVGFNWSSVQWRSWKLVCWILFYSILLYYQLKTLCTCTVNSSWHDASLYIPNYFLCPYSCIIKEFKILTWYVPYFITFHPFLYRLLT
jgi:hypothetical protein